MLEAGAPGGGTSGVSFAWTNSFNKTPRDYHDLNTAGMAEHRALVQELGGGAWHPQEGAIAWEEAPAARAHLKETVERLASWGYPVELISPQQARALEPDLHIAPHVDEVVLTKSEGYVEVVPLIGALLAHARHLGARVLPGQRVTGVLREGTRVRGATTASGSRFEAGRGGRLRGPATKRGGPAGRHRDPFDRVRAADLHDAGGQHRCGGPIHAPGVHFRSGRRGRIVLAEGAHDHVWREEAEAPEREAWPAEQSLRAVSAHFPALTGARVEATRIGVRPMPKDERPMVGAIPGLDGFYVVTSHSAVTLGPLWGRIVAAELLDGVADPRLAPYRPARFLR